MNHQWGSLLYLYENQNEMTIEQRNLVDFSCIDKEDGCLILAISDPLEWDERNQHLLQLQQKMNDYLRFIESGEIYEKIPNAPGRKIKIIVYLMYLPTDIVERFFNTAREVCQQINVELEYEMIE